MLPGNALHAVLWTAMTVRAHNNRRSAVNRLLTTRLAVVIAGDVLDFIIVSVLTSHVESTFQESIRRRRGRERRRDDNSPGHQLDRVSPSYFAH